MQPTQLHTERLLLRPFRLQDVDDVFAYASDEAWGRYMLVNQPYLREDALSFLQHATHLDWDQEADFAMELNGRVIGGAGLKLDSDRKIGEVGYSLAPQHWGLGYAAEAATAIVAWGFGSFDIAKVYATADARNSQSIRVMEKLGMTREAYFRKHRFFRGEQVDEVLYAVLRDEWPAIMSPATPTGGAA